MKEEAMGKDQPNELVQARCRPCEGGVARVGADEARQRLASLPGWALSSDLTRLERSYVFKDFRANMAFLNRVADIAEDEGHHPDFSVHYNRVDFSIFTHAIGGLSENDFILAAKIETEAVASHAPKAVAAQGKRE